MTARHVQLLALTRYGPAGASSRMRLYQYQEIFTAEGIDTEVQALLPDDYVHALYGRGRVGPALMAGWYWQRLRRLLGNRRPDVIWLEKEAFPWAPDVVERLVHRFRCPVIADYDDAWFLRYRADARPVVRRALGDKIDGVMRRATVVAAGNRWLAEHARRAGATDVRVVPTTVDPRRYTAPDMRTPGACTIGWIGSPATVAYLNAVRAPLAHAVSSGARLHLIGAPAGCLSDIGATVVPWTNATEVASLRALDIGIMPLDDTPWEQGKCGYKLLQYMAAGRPVIASPVGANVDIVQHGTNGFLASTPAEWTAALDRLMSDRALCEQFGAAGRRLIDTEYNAHRVGQALARTIRELATAPPAIMPHDHVSLDSDHDLD